MEKENILKLIALDEPSTDTGIEENPVDIEQIPDTIENADIPSEPQAPQGFELDGEVYTPEQIKAWKNSSMRQEDYTARLSQVQALEQQNKDALELYNYLKSKPELASKMREFDDGLAQNPNLNQAIQGADPIMQRLQTLESQNIQNQIQMELSQIMAKDSDVTDVELINIATANGVKITQAYDIWKGQNFDKIMQKKLAEQSKNITKNIQKNNGLTKTIISQTDINNNSNVNFGLSDSEVAFAAKVGLSAQEYAKWKK